MYAWPSAAGNANRNQRGASLSYRACIAPIVQPLGHTIGKRRHKNTGGTIPPHLEKKRLSFPRARWRALSTAFSVVCMVRAIPNTHTPSNEEAQPRVP